MTGRRRLASGVVGVAVLASLMALVPPPAVAQPEGAGFDTPYVWIFSNNDSGSDVATRTWTLCHDADPCLENTNNDGGHRFEGVDPGSYTLSVSEEVGWTLTAFPCSGHGFELDDVADLDAQTVTFTVPEVPAEARVNCHPVFHGEIYR